MSAVLEVTATLDNAKVHFSGQAGDNPAIAIDYTPPLGDGAGYLPLELLLVSLAACSGATVASLLRRMKKDVAGLRVQARGLRREAHPLAFHTIYLDFQVTSADAAEADIHKALQLSEETYCPVWAMLKASVTIHSSVQLSAGPAAA